MSDGVAEIEAPQTLVEAFQRMGGWKLIPAGRAVWRAEVDGLQLRLQVIDTVVVIAPVAPPRYGRPASMAEWSDIHRGAVPAPTRIRFDVDPPRIVERLQAGFMPEAVAFLKALGAVSQSEQALASGARDLARRIEESGGRLIEGDLSRGESATLRLNGPFAGDVVIRPDGTASIRFQEVPLEFGRKLFEAIGADISAERSRPAPIELPERSVRPRGPLPGRSGGEGGAADRLLRVAALPRTQAEIARELGVTRQAVSPVIKKLQADGLIERLPGGLIRAMPRQPPPG